MTQQNTQTVYVESERVWKGPQQASIQEPLGKAILEKLLLDDPNRVLEVNCDNGVELSVRDVLEQTIAAARMLMGKGIRKGDVVIFYSLANEKLTPLTFACYIIGAPVHFFETQFEGELITYTLGLLQPSAILYETEFGERILTALDQVKHPNLKVTLNIDKDVNLSKPGDIGSFQLPDIGDPTKVTATLMLTSGSTGFPKMIQLSHSMMLRSYNVGARSSSTRVFCFNPPRGMIQVVMMMHPLFSESLRFYTASTSSGAWGREIVDRFNVTFIIIGPHVYRDLLRAAVASNDPSSLGSLKRAIVTGDVVHDSLMEFSARVAPQCRVLKYYGMSEVGGGIALNIDSKHKSVNGGSLLPNYTVKICDEENKPLGPNERGRLFVKLPFPFLGYYGNEEATRKMCDEDGWINTGDYGFMDSNNLLNILTRYEYLIHSGGTVVVPNDIEDVVNNHPEVLVSAIVGHPNGENEKIATLFVVPKSANPPASFGSDIREFLNRVLKREEAEVVKFIRIISKMPKMTANKLNRARLRDMALSYNVKGTVLATFKLI